MIQIYDTTLRDGTQSEGISLSVDGGHTYPYVLAASTPNTGSASVVLPMVGTTHARVKIEAESPNLKMAGYYYYPGF